MVNPHRITQEPVEVAEQGTADPRRLTQLVVEVPYQQALYRLTQAVVESAEQVTGASLLRRLTQIVVEVPITQPVHPFGMPEYVPEPQWSPAYIQAAIENPAAATANYWGIHQSVIELGRRGNYIRILRR